MAWFLFLYSLVASYVYAFSRTTLTVRPYAAPRFDEFVERLVEGTWLDFDDNNNNDSSQGTGKMMVVEEVMRSCGGAVQGIRDDGNYLNRADDGFLFRNDGSYTWGPTQWSNEAEFQTNFYLNKSFRVLMQGNNVRVLCRSQVDDKLSLTGLFERNMSFSVSWIDHVQCRMPSPSMPWMVQRLKWQKLVDSDDGDIIDSETKDSEVRDIFCLNHRMLSVEALEVEWNFPNTLWALKDSQVCTSIVAVRGFIYAVCREYDKERKLKNVVWSRGAMEAKEGSY